MASSARGSPSSPQEMQEKLVTGSIYKGMGSVSAPHEDGGNVSANKSSSRTYMPRKKVTKFVDQAPKHRSAMGEYVVPEGGEPLTQNEKFRPIGPADYTQPRINLYKNQSPEWSIQTRHPQEFEDGVPPPNQYELPEGIILKRKFTFGKRLKPNKKAIAGACRQGPTYSVKGHETGKNGPKFSMPKGQRGGLGTGPPNPLVTPVDSTGFKTPAAEAFSMDGVRPHPFHATVTGRIPPQKKKDIPGPNHYNLSPLSRGLEKSFGAALKSTQNSRNVPAPNKYMLPDSLGQGPKYSMGLPLRRFKPPRCPSPCTYMKEREYHHKELTTFGYAAIAPRIDETPGPCTYDLRYKGKPKGFTFKDRVRVTYPEVLHSAYAEAFKNRSPGPAAHKVKNPRTVDRGATFKGKHPPTHQGARPGPSDYGRLECGQLSTKPCPPSYSMRSAWPEVLDKGVPGPNRYRTVPLDEGLSTSIKSRHRSSTRQAMPAPNAYIPKKCTRFGPCADEGITMKSRHSPWVFSGLKQAIKA